MSAPFFTIKDFPLEVEGYEKETQILRQLLATSANIKVASLLNRIKELEEAPFNLKGLVEIKAENARVNSENLLLRAALEHSNAIMEHAIAIGYLNPGGSTEGSFKDAIDKARAALVAAAPKDGEKE